MPFKDCESVIHVFISSRPDYCNVLYSGAKQASLLSTLTVGAEHSSMSLNKNTQMRILLLSWPPFNGSQYVLGLI